MGKWIAFSVAGILLFSILQVGHGVIDSLLLLLFFLIFDRKGHFIVVLLVLALLLADDVRSRREREQAKKQMVDAIRRRTADMEARIALLEGRAEVVQEEGGKEGDRAAPGSVDGRVNPEGAEGARRQGWRTLLVDLVKAVVFVSCLSLLWVGSVYLFSCGEPNFGRLEVSFRKCEMH